MNLTEIDEATIKAKAELKEAKWRRRLAQAEKKAADAVAAHLTYAVSFKGEGSKEEAEESVGKAEEAATSLSEAQSAEREAESRAAQAEEALSEAAKALLEAEAAKALLDAEAAEKEIG